MNTSYKIIGQNIKAARESTRLTQTQSAKMLDMSPLYYDRIERGERPVTLPQLATIAELFGVSTGALLTGCLTIESLTIESH